MIAAKTHALRHHYDGAERPMLPPKRKTLNLSINNDSGNGGRCGLYDKQYSYDTPSSCIVMHRHASSCYSRIQSLPSTYLGYRQSELITINTYPVNNTLLIHIIYQYNLSNIYTPYIHNIQITLNFTELKNCDFLKHQFCMNLINS